MNEDCGCCEGVEELTPEATANSPGLDAISYRVGTHATFLETMKARLSAHCLDADGTDCEGRPRPLLALTTRAADDPSVAMLDAWATVADVLTFYQERIANEGYLRTATERRSLLELARLIGYKPHDGVAASVYLAFTLDEGTEATIPAGTRAQSVPAGQGELIQPFETSEPLPARGKWNTLVPRRTRPTDLSQLYLVQKEDYHLYLKGTATNLSVNDALLVIVGGTMLFYRVVEVNADATADRTHVRLRTWTRAGVAPPVPVASTSNALTRLREIADTALAQVGTNINPDLKTAIAANKLLEALKQALDKKRAGEVLLFLEEEVLPELHRLVSQPAVQRSPNLRTWLAGIIEELEDVVGSLTAEAPDEEVNLDELFDEPDLFNLPSTVESHYNMYGPPEQVPTIELTRALAEQLVKPASKQPASSARLGRGIEDSFYATSDTAARLSTAFQPALKTNLYRALENAPVTPPPPVQVYAMRKQVKLFGSTAPQQTRLVTATQPPGADNGSSTNMSTQYVEWTPAADEQKDLLFLDSGYDKILPGSYVVVHRPDKDAPVIFTGKEVSVRARAAYGVSGDTTLIKLNMPWWLPREEPGTGNNPAKHPDPPTPFDAIRGTVVFAQSEPLELVEEPITDDICAGGEPDDAQKIELDGVYDGLEPGRWLIITGERTDIAVREQRQMTDASRTELTGVEMSGGQGAGMRLSMTGAEPALAVPAITATELVMLGGVEHGYNPALFGDSMHTTIVLAERLAYCYKRETVTIYGNVAHATHGETREEVLGSGDGAKAMQSFALRQSPLTYVSAATPSGVESTLTVRVNGVRWHETDTLAGLGPKDRSYVTRTDDEAKTTVVFGNGERGARLPTGVENVRAVYRTGIGRPGNVKPGQISLLATKPLNVSKVVNPQAATGGADRVSGDAIRRNAPLAVMSLDRLVSVRDYEDFARTFAGVGKASAQRLTDGRRQIVHLTIAGADDIPIAPESDLFNNLRAALLKYGDPYQPLEIEVRALRLLVVSADVLIDPDYLWENVEPQVRGALLARFSFDRRGLGQDAYLSEVMGAIQSVPGVVYADVNVFDALDEDLSTTSLEMIGRRHKPRQRIPVRLARVEPYATTAGGRILPAQLALLSPAVPETLLLKELKA